jgi:putative pyruvate formate lyase activating enzyme
MTPEPGYISLFRSGELERRTEALEARLKSCDICPRECGKDRPSGKHGHCHSGYLPVVSAVCAHQGEEPAISGTKGSGTVFFGNCNLRCVYCQNYQISQDWKAQQHNETGFHTLAERMVGLQESGCHNINLVSPSHFVPQIARTLIEAVPMELRIPLVYNTGSYDSVRTLQSLDGIISIYLADLRYASDRWARKYSHARYYVENARAAIKEMYRQVGELKTDGQGIAQKGLIVRLLILPENIAGIEESLTWLAQELSSKITISVMSQYYPTHKARKIKPLSRKITTNEYNEVVKLLDQLGIENGWVQELDSPEHYLPDFTRKEYPFTPEAAGQR